MADSWRVVAEVLAARMAHHANNCPSGISPMGEVDEQLYGPLHKPEIDWRHCPFCDDTMAYRQFRRKQATSRK